MEPPPPTYQVPLLNGKCLRKSLNKCTSQVGKHFTLELYMWNNFKIIHTEILAELSKCN